MSRWRAASLLRRPSSPEPVERLELGSPLARIVAAARRRPEIAALWVLLILGFAARLYFTLIWQPAITGYSDSGIYFQDVHQGIWTDPVRTVGYAMFLIALHAITPHLIFVVVVQHLMGLGVAALIFATVRRIGGPRWLGLVPAAIIALGGDELFIEHAALSETVYIFLLTLMLYCAVRAANGGRLVWAAAAGLCAGLGVWDRGAAISLLPIVPVWLALSRRRPSRRTLAMGLLSAVFAFGSVGGYIEWRHLASGESGLTTNGNWNLYARVAPWADCTKFTPPPGTQQLCESTPVGKRRLTSGETYVYDPNSPGYQLIGPAYQVSSDPYAMSRLWNFAMSAIWGQPLDYLHAVWLDTIRLVDPNHFSYGDLSADSFMGFMLAGPTEHTGKNGFVTYWEHLVYPGDTVHRGQIHLLKTWEKVTRFDGPWMVLLLALCIGAPWLVQGRARAGARLLAITTLVLLFFPLFTKGYDYRFVIPAFGPLFATAALAAWGIATRVSGRRRLGGRPTVTDGDVKNTSPEPPPRQGGASLLLSRRVAPVAVYAVGPQRATSGDLAWRGQPRAALSWRAWRDAPRAAWGPQALRDRVRAAWGERAWRDAIFTSGSLLTLVFITGAGAYLLFGSPITGRPGVLDTPGLVDGLGSVQDVLAAPFAHWDSAWYLLTAHNGYGLTAGTTPVYYPLYPLAISIVGALGAGDLVAGVLISVVSLVIALRLIWLLTDLEVGRAYPDAPRLAVLATALFPTAFFFTAVYTESLYLALTLGAFWMGRRGRWAWAGALGGLSAATRSSGVLIIVGLALLYWRAHGRRLRVDVLWLALVPVGLGAYMAWLSLHGLSAFSPFSEEHLYLRSFAGPLGGPWDGLKAAVAGVRQLLSGSDTHIYWPAAVAYGYSPMMAARDNVELFGFLMLAVAALVSALRRLPLAYGAYAATALAVAVSYPIAAQPLASLSRYVLVIFPLPIAAGCWLAEHRRWRVPLLGLSSVALTYYAAEFATWHWVA